MVESFNWILPKRLAGSGRPGLLSDLQADLDGLKEMGIHHIVSLTSRKLQGADGMGFEIHHFPIPDMGIPMPRHAQTLCQFILEAIERQEPVLLHCKAGLGRTGTMLACCLVSLGASSDQAIARIRGVSSFYIQTAVQERFIYHYAEFLREEAATGELPECFLTPAPEPDNLKTDQEGVAGGRS